MTMDRFKALDLHVITKPDLTPVSDADTAVEEAIRRTLGRARPRDAVLGEELGATGWGPRRWVIDPIDGTKNFVRGVPVWATLIGLMVEDEVVAGVVSAPALGRRWWASMGTGAWTGRSLARGQRVPRLGRLAARRRATSRTPPVAAGTSAAGSTTSSRSPGAAGAPGRSATSGPTCSSPRAAWTWPPSPSWLHDMAAVSIIVDEAGGRFTGLDGTPGPGGGNALASNGRLHDQALAFIGSLPDDQADPDTAPPSGGGSGRSTTSRLGVSGWPPSTLATGEDDD